MNKIINYKYFIFFIFYIVFTLSFAFNIFHISFKRSFFSFDDALTMGRIVETQERGLRSNAGFPCVIFDKSTVPDSIKNHPDFYTSYKLRDYIVDGSIENQFRYYLGEDTNIPSDIYPYTSQSGGNAIFLSIINELLPFNPYLKLNILRFFNASLLSLVLLLFIGWCSRNYGLFAAIIVSVLIFLSPWFVFLGSSLWWSVYTYYIPFTAMLLMLERRNKYPEKISERKIFLVLFLAVLLKHLLYGFEFASTILLAIYPPIIYYYWIEKRSFKSFFIFSIKSGIVSLAAVALQTLMYLYQLSILMGNGLRGGMEHIAFLFSKRATMQEHESLSYTESLFSVLKTYFTGDAFNPNLWKTEHPFFSYLVVICIVIILSIIIYYFAKKYNHDIRKYTALFVATSISILCPLSWYIIFVEHSMIHPHRDYIIWYVPFMLYSFLIVGIFISFSFSVLSKKIKGF